MKENILPEHCSKATVILGCGNVLFGDDGFGPEVVNHLVSHYKAPNDVSVMDVGSAVREVLMDIALSPDKPGKIVVIDAMESGKPPGSITLSTPEDLPGGPNTTFSFHQAPTSLLLKELEKIGNVEVMVLSVQPRTLPQEVQPGLSAEVRAAVGQASQLIARRFFHA